MIKTIIVDDDIEMLTGLENIISWEEYGFKLIGKATNGKKALELVNKTNPNLIITDITMPAMNGLELIKEAKNLTEDIKVIMLTCHEDFDYAKEALELGADDYLVKYSLTDDKLIKVLKNIKSKIEIEEIKKNRLDKIKSNLKNNRQVLLQKFFLDIIENNYFSIEEIYKRSEQLDIKLPKNEYQLIGLFIDDYPLAIEKAKINKKHLIKFCIQNMIQEICDTLDDGSIFWYEKTAILIIDSAKIDNKMHEWVNDIEKFQSRVYKHLNLNISVCISDEYQNIKRISSAIKDLSELRNSYFYTGPGSLVREKKEFKNKLSVKESLLYIDELRLLLSSTDYNNIYQELNILFDRKEKNEYSPDSVRTFLRSLIIDIESTANHYGISLGEVYLNLDTFKEYKNLITRLIKQFYEKLSDTKNSSYRREIIEVMTYINRNIDKSITCEMMADYVNMNSSYFSRLFKQETGVSFSDYLINKRIQKATDLLMSTNLPVEEISIKVGIDNVSYFYRLYKKRVGKTPGYVRKG